MYLRRLPSGRWYAQYRDAAGRRHGKSFPTKTEARLWGQDQEALVRAGRHRDPIAGRQPLREYEKVWWAARVAEASTLATDRGRLDKHVIPAFGDTPLAAITPTLVQAWVKRLVRDGLAPATARSCHQLLASILDAARRDGLIYDNPCRGITLPAVPPGHERFLTREEIAKVAQGMEEPHATVLWTLALTGLRWGELAGLPWSRVDLGARRLVVAQTLVEAGGRVIKAYPKGGKQRTVPIPVELAGRLAELPRSAGAGSLVFPGLSRHTWARAHLHPAADAAGVPRFRVHDLRHTYASWLVQAGVPLYEVQRVLGHSSITTTQRYAHLAPDAYDRVEQALALQDRESPVSQPPVAPSRTQSHNEAHTPSPDGLAVVPSRTQS